MSRQTPNNTDGEEELNQQLLDQCQHPNPDIAVVKSLLERNANINYYYYDEGEMNVKSPLLNAIDSKNYEIVDFLLQEPGIDVNIRHPHDNRSILHLLSDPDHDTDQIILLTTIITRIVVDHGLDIDIRDDCRVTPLLSAAGKANEPIARILIQLGADLTAQDDDGYSVIFHCIQSRYYSRTDKTEEFALKLLNYLLENQRDSFDLERGYGGNEFDTPVIYACERDNVPILKTLIEKYNVNLQPHPNNPTYAFTTAVYYNSPEVMDYLLTNYRHLFDINVLDGNFTPFLYCCRMGYGDSAITLLQHGADHTIKSGHKSLSYMDYLLVNYNGKTKRDSSRLKTISTLATAYPHVFDVNCTVDALGNGKQCTALLLACREDNIELVMVLVDHGVNLDVEDVNGLNIVHYAVQSVRTRVLSYLFEKQLPSIHLHKLATAFTKPTDTIHAMDPVMMACKYSRFESAKLFIPSDDFDVLRQTNNTQFEFGQTTNREPQQSRTLLHLACDYHPGEQEEEFETVECPDLVELLIDKVIDRILL